jgi:hypothetical protein
MTQGEEPSSGFIHKKVPAFTETPHRPDPDHGDIGKIKIELRVRGEEGGASRGCE